MTAPHKNVKYQVIYATPIKGMLQIRESIYHPLTSSLMTNCLLDTLEQQRNKLPFTSIIYIYYLQTKQD
jgi:hypothetical protein